MVKFMQEKYIFNISGTQAKKMLPPLNIKNN